MASGVRLDFNLHPEFDDPVGWQTEVGGRAGGIATQDGKQTGAPTDHPIGSTGGDDGLAAEEERRFHGLELQIERGATFQHVADVGFLEESVAGPHAPETTVQFLHFDAILIRHPGGFLENDRQNDNSAVQHLVVFEVVQQGEGGGIAVAGEVNGGARDPHRFATFDLRDKLFQRLALERIRSQTT